MGPQADGQSVIYSGAIEVIDLIFVYWIPHDERNKIFGGVFTMQVESGQVLFGISNETLPTASTILPEFLALGFFFFCRVLSTQIFRGMQTNETALHSHIDE